MSEKPIQILLVEDNPGDARLIREHLADAGAASFKVETVQTLVNAFERCSRRGVDAVLLDLGLPDSVGLDTLSAFQSREPELPVVVLTGLDDEKLAVQAVRAGAQDYLIKGETSGILMARALRYAIERKRAEAALLESEETYRSLVAGLPDIVMSFDREGRHLFVSDNIDELVDLPAARFIGKTHRELDFPEDQCRFWEEAIHRVFESGVPFETEFTFVGKRGPVIHNWRLLPERDTQGTMQSVLCISRDITEHKLAQVQEKLERRILGLLNRPDVKGSTIRVIMHLIKHSIGIEAVGIRLREDDDFPYYEANGFSDDFLHAERFLCERDEAGQIVRDAAGNPVLECMCGNILCGRTDPSLPFFTKGGSFWSNCTTDLLASTSEADRQARTRNRCNGEGYESVALIPLRSGNKIIGLLQLNDHRPDQFTLPIIKFFEELSASIGIALDRKLAEAERETLQSQFSQAQKLESVARLAGGVAHDFNNMLCVIIGRAEIALEKLDSADPARSNLLEIITAGRHSAALTRQLLAFARKQVIDPKVLDLNDTVGGMLKMLRRLIGENIDLRWKPAANLWPVKMDPSQVDQILANLVVNARDAIADVGKVTIETEKVEIDAAYCSHHVDAVPGSYVMLAVSDDGHGMDQEIMAQIFEPFFTTKGVGKGTGLGLAMIFGIVKQNHGFISVDSESGKGTTFKIYLPRLESAEVPLAEGQIVTETPTGTETVLLVEDEKVLLELAKTQLMELGYTVLTADTPVKASRLAKKHDGEIHLLLTDVVMPEMSGRELVKQINLQQPGIKCLFMSGYTADVIAHQGVLDEGIHFLQKPFSMESLAVKVREALEGK